MIPPFYFRNGTSANNLLEMRDVLAKLSPEDFSHHVNYEKNDIMTWVEHGLKDPELANKLRGIKSNEQALDVLNTVLGYSSNSIQQEDSMFSRILSGIIGKMKPDAEIAYSDSRINGSSIDEQPARPQQPSNYGKGFGYFNNYARSGWHREYMPGQMPDQISEDPGVLAPHVVYPSDDRGYGDSNRGESESHRSREDEFKPSYTGEPEDSDQNKANSSEYMPHTASPEMNEEKNESRMSTDPIPKEELEALTHSSAAPKAKKGISPKYIAISFAALILGFILGIVIGVLL